MSAFLVGALTAVALLIVAGLHRVWAGPTIFDRLVAVALVTANGVVILVLLGATLERPNLFFDIGISYALLAFLLPLALGRYFEYQIRSGQEASTDDATSRRDDATSRHDDATSRREDAP